MSDILDGNSMHRLSYQLKIINSEKSLKTTVAMAEKGFIPYIAKIFVSK